MIKIHACMKKIILETYRVFLLLHYLVYVYGQVWSWLSRLLSGFPRTELRRQAPLPTEPSI